VNLRHLASFVATAEHLHFTRAAEQLKIAQPALSQQIRKLEQDLGVELFIRGGRKVELSEFGNALLPRARQLINQAQLARKEIREMSGLERGHLRVGASGTIAAFLLPELLAQFRERYPCIVLEIVQRRSEPVLGLVEAGELDVGLIRLPVRPTTFKLTHIFTEPLYAALPPDHPRAGDDQVPLRALADDQFIMPVSETEPFYRTLINLFAEEGFNPNIISAGAEYTTAFRLVGMGMGVSIVSELGTNMCVSPSPAFVRLQNQKATSPVVMVAARESLSPAVEAFCGLVLGSNRGDGGKPEGA
jgi:DNA-binding transcriptional LysR family regulator